MWSGFEALCLLRSQFGGLGWTSLMMCWTRHLILQVSEDLTVKSLRVRNHASRASVGIGVGLVWWAIQSVARWGRVLQIRGESASWQETGKAILVQ